MIKALVSFANTDGGFIVFGVDPKGKWLGFTKAELQDTDPAMIAELINECITPELLGLNYGLLRAASRSFPILHVPPSSSMPHYDNRSSKSKR
jgi:predicted HTH transcriptional regulator